MSFVPVQLLALARGTDEPVARASGILGHDRPPGGDVDGNRPLRPVIDGGVVSLIEVPLEGDAFADP